MAIFPVKKLIAILYDKHSPNENKVSLYHFPCRKDVSITLYQPFFLMKTVANYIFPPIEKAIFTRVAGQFHWEFAFYGERFTGLVLFMSHAGKVGTEYGKTYEVYVNKARHIISPMERMPVCSRVLAVFSYENSS